MFVIFANIVEECADVFDDIIDSDPTFGNGERDGPLLYDNENVSYSPTLFIGKSKYRSLISTRSIGLGLFTRIDIPSGNEICRYIGERTSKEKYEEDARQGFSHYCIMISPSEYYNCYQQAKIGLCKASFANSPIQLEGAPKQNARREGMKLFAISAIPANEEVLCSYGLGYKFPRDTERTVLKFD